MRTRRGFTLFEILIALMLVVILLGTLASTIGVAWKQKRAAENAVENVRDVQAVGDILVDALQCALPPWIDPSTIVTYDADGNPIYPATAPSTSPSTPTDTTTSDTDIYIYHLVGPFHGDQNSIGFYASGNELKADVQGGTRWIEFAAVSGYDQDGNLSLVRRVETNLLRDDWDVDNPTDSNLEDEVLINHVISLTFQYADANGTLTDTWYSEDNRNTLPSAVVMDLELAPLGDSKDNRIIHRVASIYCAVPAVDTTTDLANGTATNGPNGTNTTGSNGLQF